MSVYSPTRVVPASVRHCYEDNAGEYLNTFTCLKCWCLVDEIRLEDHYNWHEGVGRGPDSPATAGPQ